LAANVHFYAFEETAYSENCQPDMNSMQESSARKRDI